jgi:hypothetical protein
MQPHVSETIRFSSHIMATFLKFYTGIENSAINHDPNDKDAIDILPTFHKYVVVVKYVNFYTGIENTAINHDPKDKNDIHI